MEYELYCTSESINVCLPSPTTYSGADIPVFLLTMFTKNEKTDLPPKERTALKKALPEVVKTYKARSTKR